jgi:triacylglycerol lipase
MDKKWPDSAVMMTLAGIAYSSDIGNQLKNTDYATEGDWSVVWGPSDDSYGNLAYVATSASTGKYALVIRGSETSFSWDTLYNWFYNLYVTWQSPWPIIPGAMISYGSHVQASQLTIASWNGQTLGQFLTNIPKGATLAVTGHSLGGNLGTVLASWISSIRGPAETLPDPNTEVYTFAAPSAGNTEFANGFTARFPKSYRYWNSLDAVPRGWDNLLGLLTIYDSIGIPTPSWIWDAVVALETALIASEWEYGSYYLQPNGNGNQLTGSALPLTNDYVLEVAYQHGVNVYLGLLNAPLLKQGANLLDAAAFEPGAHLPRPQPMQRKAVQTSATKPIAGLPNPALARLAETSARAGLPRARTGF